MRIAICGVFFEKYHHSYIHVSTCDGFDCLPSKAHIDAMLHWIAKAFYDSKKGIFERIQKTEYDSLVKKGFTFDRRKAKLNRFILEMNRLRHIPQKGQPMYEMPDIIVVIRMIRMYLRSWILGCGGNGLGVIG